LAYKLYSPLLGEAALHLTADGLAEIIASVFVSSALLLGVVAAALRFAVRPLLEDWFKLRSQGAGPGLERRLAQMEENIRRLEAGTGLQLPAESLRSTGQPRT
jgi:hypothetical protein